MFLDQVYQHIKQRSTRRNARDERPLRSFLKAISWRAFGTIDTMLIAWLISQDLSIAFSIGSIELITKTFLYYFHERMWNKIKWGK